jgi:hypothetical protein
MSREEILSALRDLGDGLAKRNIDAKLFVVGGAVMVLAHDSRDATFDVDGDFYPRDVVTEVAAEVARARDLPHDWLNAAANVFVPIFRSPDWRPLYSFGTLEIFVADNRAMLAMKIRASRGRRDEPDIALLLRLCGVGSVDQAFALYEEYFPEDPAPSRAREILGDLLS